ncbi:phospholipase D-like domain-containing protein [Roseivivax isoporae]|uniref:Phospholipase D n=1 Tax=Roseivivax isoporae LMG 25204 TaxID=1449351 RepID=X7FG09_9RHOB|nr:phospholipase D family protein [Roseivivax isoporae]ETX30944.1 phospholipase [Roseivivax isoporae LMG 25204]
MESSDRLSGPSDSRNSETRSGAENPDSGTGTELSVHVTAAEIFPELEALADGAREELLLSFRIFDPKTKLRTPALRDRGLDDWGDLLALVVRRGVRLRLVVTDFDPLFASDLHRLSWSTASGIVNRVTGDAEVLIAPHGQEVGWIWRRALILQVAEKLRELKREAQNRLTPVQRKVLKSRPFLWPVSLHQKVAVADGRVAIVGGLDLNERRWDDNDHDRPAEETWHDVSARVEGSFAGAVRAHVVDTWNAAIEAGASSVDGRATPLEAPVREQGTSELRLVRTVSTARNGPFGFGPAPHLTENEDVTLQGIAAARRHIYIESQFLRHRPITRALIAAANRVPDLQLVLLLPPEPERILFGGDDTWDARHAHALQTLSLNDVRDAYGDRVALISPGQNRPASEGFAGALGGAGPIYVHAKVTLIDDTFGMVGSANLNGRSMRWDTEASILFRRPTVIRDLRLKLARKWLGAHLGDQDSTRAEVWNVAARENAARPPEERQGFVMPYPLGRGRRFARYLPLLPDEMF